MTKPIAQIILRICIIVFMGLVALTCLTNCATIPIQAGLESPWIKYPMGEFNIQIYTQYDGEINPHEFPFWTITNMKECELGGYHFHLMITDGDNYIEIMVMPVSGETVILIGYMYTLDNIDN